MSKKKLTAKEAKQKKLQVDRIMFHMDLFYSVKWVLYLNTTLEVSFTQIHPVNYVHPQHRATIDAMISTLHTVRANTYNKLGSMQRWGMSWMKTQNIIKALDYEYEVEGVKLPAKIFEWNVQDTVKNIIAQQEAAKTAVIKRIYKRLPVVKGDKLTKEQEKTNKINLKIIKEAIKALDSFEKIKEIPWLHRFVREEYKRGHCHKNRQIVLQPQAYSCKRVSRYLVELMSQSPIRGYRLRLLVKTNRMISGQIRVIYNESGELEIHNLVTLYNYDLLTLRDRQKEMGVDRGYTEVFYTSNGDVWGDGFGKQLTKKTDRITQNGRNKNKLWSLANVKYAESNPAKANRIRRNNLTNKTELKRRNRDDSYVETVVNTACRIATEQAELIAVESLVDVINSSKRLSRKAKNRLNMWQKGTVINRLCHWAKRNKTEIVLVNAAYTSQVDRLTGTLLGARNGDNFIRFTGDVVQADHNAALNILDRVSDDSITRYMKYKDVQGVLIRKTALFLSDMGFTLKDAVDRGWLNKKFLKQEVCQELLHGL